MQVNVEVPDSLIADCKRIAGNLNLSFSDLHRQSLRVQSARYRVQHPEWWYHAALTPYEDIALEAIQEGFQEFSEIQDYCRLTEQEAQETLDALIEKKRIEKRKRAKPDSAPGQPEIYVEIECKPKPKQQQQKRAAA